LASLVYCSSGEPAYWRKAASEGESETCAGAYRKPTIWSAAFPNTPARWFWSSSPYADYADDAWYVDFDNGYVYYYRSKSYAKYVRLVRGGQSGGPGAASPPRGATAAAASASPTERYRFVGKDQGIVEDIRTKLQWQRCSLGQTWTGATCTGKATEHEWDEAQRIAPTGWRLPTKEELASLVYCSSGQPAYWKPPSEGCKGAYDQPTIWSAAFPNTPKDWFWSSSPYATHSGYAWIVNFDYGIVYSPRKSTSLKVRLVRGGQ
jgi:hypothetical protein